MDDHQTVKRVAKAMAYGIRQISDVSRDEDEYWDHTASLTQVTWMVAAAIAVSTIRAQDAQTERTI